MARVEPLQPPWSAKDAEDIGRWGHPDATYDPLLLVRCLQRHPRLARRVRELGESVYVDGLLPGRARTLAILRTCALVGCAYEWGGQAAFWGPLTDVDGDDCDALAAGVAEDGRWSRAEQRLLRAVDELEATGSWSELTWAELGTDFDDEQRMELLVLCGWYRMICTLCNAMALPVEDWMRAWPASG